MVWGEAAGGPPTAITCCRYSHYHSNYTLHNYSHYHHNTTTTFITIANTSSKPHFTHLSHCTTAVMLTSTLRTTPPHRDEEGTRTRVPAPTRARQ